MNQKGKILVVDDDRLVLATLTHGLSQAGFEVIDADNGDDAILLAREHRPELALLDIRMEGKSGFDVAAYLREYLQTPFMFLSAFADEGTIKQVKELGALTYLVKPLDIQQIVPAVEAAFANQRGRAGALGQLHDVEAQVGRVAGDVEVGRDGRTGGAAEERQVEVGAAVHGVGQAADLAAEQLFAPQVGSGDTLYECCVGVGLAVAGLLVRDDESELAAAAL